jgi:hypothetical protein
MKNELEELMKENERLNSELELLSKNFEYYYEIMLELRAENLELKREVKNGDNFN